MLTAGTIIKKERERQNLSLEDISAGTKIQKHYLEALENDEYEKFPSAVYAKGFLQNYARYLKIDPGKVLALFRRSVDDNSKAEVRYSKRSIKDVKFTVTPSVIIITSIILLVVSTLGYLFYQFYNFQKPPMLEIHSPENNSTVESNEITVKGKTKRDMFLTINDEAIRINEDGSFEVNITLSEGQNTIVIKSKHPDDIGKEAVLTRNIEYSPPIAEEANEEVAGEEIEKEETSITMQISIEITQESTWLEVEIDERPEITSIVLPGTTLEYQAEKSIYLKTGKVPSTKLKINEEEKLLYISDSGIGIIECKLEKETVNCQKP